MAYQPWDHVRIYDGNTKVELRTTNGQRHQVDIPDGTPGIVNQPVFGGALYIVLVSTVVDGRVITGYGLFPEPTLRQQ